MIELDQDWLSKSGKKNLIIAHLPKSKNERRKALFICQMRFHEILGSEGLDNLHLYLTETIINNTPAQYLLEDAKKELEWGLYEYSFYLNAISKSLEINIEDKFLSENDLVIGFNALLEAYSCCLEESKFLHQETNFILSTLNE